MLLPHPGREQVFATRGGGSVTASRARIAPGHRGPEDRTPGPAGTARWGACRPRSGYARGMSRTPPAIFVCVLRASSAHAGVGALLRTHPKLKPEAVWKRGSTDPHGRKRRRGGFSLLLTQGSDWKGVCATVRRRLGALVPMIEQGRADGVAFEVDVSVIPGERFLFRSTRFAADDLEKLGRLGVELSVTTRPPQGPPPAR
jgi:hypothetical protein